MSDRRADREAICEPCGDALSLHIGGKPCVVGESRDERRARYVREQESKRNHRLFGDVR